MRANNVRKLSGGTEGAVIIIDFIIEPNRMKIKLDSQWKLPNNFYANISFMFTT